MFYDCMSARSEIKQSSTEKAWSPTRPREAGGPAASGWAWPSDKGRALEHIRIPEDELALATLSRSGDRRTFASTPTWP